jgi:tryptophanyl-tRNA synthetase
VEEKETTAEESRQIAVRRPSSIPGDRDIVFSGIQPSGEIHVGNYLGAIRNWVRLLDTHYCIFCIVDYHAMTLEFDPAEMSGKVFDAALANMAAGLDPQHCVLFVQSRVPEHTELTWIFNTVTPIGELGRMTQFKEKSRAHEENINMGLFDYPVLQAADILLYKATAVPVGEDQVQHIELCRTIARKFNARFGSVFPLAWPLLTPTKRVMGLDGKSKMSKSLGNHLGLLWSDELVREKLKPAFTDPARLRRSDPGNPEICNIFTMHTGFSDEETIAMVDRECRRAGIGCFECKAKLADAMNAVLAPVREKAEELRAHPDTVRDVLNFGAALCQRIAEETMEEVRHAIGIR